MADEQHPKDLNDDNLTLDRGVEDVGHDLNLEATESFKDPWEEDHLPEGTDYNEEAAVELAGATPVKFDADVDKERDFDDDATSGRGIGIFALVLSIMSLFFLPVFLGIAGIVVGIVARRFDAKALGNWSIAIGAISIIMKVFFSSMF